MHAEHGLTALLATHNPRLAAACDRTLRLEGGRLHPAWVVPESCQRGRRGSTRDRAARIVRPHVANAGL